MTARFRVLVTDRAWPDTSIEQQIVSETDAEIVGVWRRQVVDIPPVVPVVTDRASGPDSAVRLLQRHDGRW